MFDSTRRCRFIGAVHVHPLPGSPDWAGSMRKVIDLAAKDASGYVDAGVDALILENTHDVPYQRGMVDASTISGMTAVACALMEQIDVPMGIQLLAGADIEAISVAIACGLAFVRAEGFVYAHVADEGIIEGNAAALLRRRTYLGGQGTQVWADIKKKHCSHALTADLDVREVAMGAAYCRADAIIVTGTRTGVPPQVDDIEAALGAGRPVYVGSGVDPSNIATFGKIAHGVIVGTACKMEGDWRNQVDPPRVHRLLDALRST